MTTSIAKFHTRISRITHTIKLFLTLGLISLVMPLSQKPSYARMVGKSLLQKVVTAHYDA